MDDDARVKPLSNAEIRRSAKQLRNFFGLREARRIDVIDCLASEKIWTRNGEKLLIFRARPDAEMGQADAKTTHGNGVVTIESKQSVCDQARMGVGRDRHTLAHELGHAALHDGIDMPRLMNGNKTPPWMKAFESSEHQAKVFAAAFLINDDVAETLEGAIEISIEFGISIESAEIYFEGLVERREREHSKARIRRIADQIIESEPSSGSKLTYLDEACPICSDFSIFPIANKFMCQKCDAIFDRLQDGDPGFG